MPELPDITVTVEALQARVAGERLEAVRLASPFLLRTVAPAPADVLPRRVERVGRLGKRIVLSLEGGVHAVVHLMIAGRFRWRKPKAAIPGRIGLAAFDFGAGTLLLTEAGSKRRASLHFVEGAAGLASLDRGGAEILEIPLETFAGILASESHTLKRALTDPRLFSGIGNTYSDEILHRARLSPMKRTRDLDGDQTARLYEAARSVLSGWTERIRRETGEGFPEKLTAFRDGMAAHGRAGKPCPDCGSPIQRIVWAENECNYCARCQTGGRLLADRALSRLLREDWPRTLEDMEEMEGLKAGGAPGRSGAALTPNQRPRRGGRTRRTRGSRE